MMEYTVKKLAALAKVSPRTLRYYDEIGLLKPARINSCLLYTSVVNHAERKETDPNKAEYLHWLRTQLEAIAIDESQHREF